MPKITPIKAPRVPLNGFRETIRIPGQDFPTYIYEAETPLLATESEEAALIAADAEVTVPILFGGLILVGILYSVNYFVVPLLKLIKVPGANWFADFVNDALGYITAPIKDFAKGLLNWIARGVEAHAAPITRVMEAGAWVLHDLSIELANFASTVTTDTALIVTEVIPREINKATRPIRIRLRNLESDINAYNVIARQNGFANFRTLLKVETPRITELRQAETYVKTQHHVSLAGALSTYETSAQRVRVYEETVRKLKFYDVPAWIQKTTTITTRTIPQTIKKLALRVGKIETLLKLNKQGIPTLLALMTPAAIGSWFKPAIPEVCTQVGDCAANNLLGSNLWKYFKDLLGLLLALTVGAFALDDVCAISKLARDVVNEIEPEIRGIVVVTGGLASIGCAGAGQTLGPPLY